MNIMVEIGNQYLRLRIDDNIGPLLEALSKTEIYQSKGWASDKKFVPCGTAERPERPGIEIVDDVDFEEATPIIASMTQQVESANKQWLEQYNRANELDKELKELKAKVAGLNGGNSQEGAGA